MRQVGYWPLKYITSRELMTTENRPDLHRSGAFFSKSAKVFMVQANDALSYWKTFDFGAYFQDFTAELKPRRERWFARVEVSIAMVVNASNVFHVDSCWVNLDSNLEEIKDRKLHLPQFMYFQQKNLDLNEWLRTSASVRPFRFTSWISKGFAGSTQTTALNVPVLAFLNEFALTRRLLTRSLPRIPEYPENRWNAAFTGILKKINKLQQISIHTIFEKRYSEKDSLEIIGVSPSTESWNIFLFDSYVWGK